MVRKKHMIKNQIEEILDIRSDFYINKKAKQKRIKRDKIRVGFIVQMPELWNKQKTIYQRMVSDSHFIPYLIIVPYFDIITNSINGYGKELDFFLNECFHENYIIAYKNHNWENIKELAFDYLFYQRPYDHYLPRNYRSSQTMKYTKVCYIPYAAPGIHNIYPNSFFRNIYLGFMEDENAVKINEHEHIHKNHKSFYNVGYPAFEECLSFNHDCQYKQVLWTPRWTYDKKAGESHFFEYKDALTNYEWKDKKLIVRPHPLMWDEFKRKGLINEEEIEELKQKWKEKGIAIDNNSDYNDSFVATDILISDISSLIPAFFLTGKPIIFCNTDADFTVLFRTIMPGLYIVNNESELLFTLSQLLNGIDELANIRNSIIVEYFLQHKNATENIIGVIKEDYYKEQ